MSDRYQTTMCADSDEEPEWLGEMGEI